MNYWSSTKSPVHLFRMSYETPEKEAFLRENFCIDASMLAFDIHLNPQVVRAYQRRLGLRAIAPNNPGYPVKR